MNAIAKLSRNQLRMIWLGVVALLVSGLLAWQASDASADQGYSVTIEQLQ